MVIPIWILLEHAGNNGHGLFCIEFDVIFINLAVEGMFHAEKRMTLL